MGLGGAWGDFFISNLVMWYIKMKGMMSRIGIQVNFLHYGQTGDLGSGSKGQISLNFFEGVGICDDSPLTAHFSLLVSLVR